MRYFKVSGLIFFLSCISTYSQLPHFEWSKQIGDNLSDVARYSCVDQNNNLYVLGEFSGVVDFDPGPGTNIIPAFGNNDVFISKYNPTGDLIWVKRIGSGNYEYAYAIVADVNGNVYISFESLDDVDVDPGPAYHVIPVGATEAAELIVKLDSSGNFVWVNEYVFDYNSDYMAINTLALDENNDLLAGGFLQGSINFNPQGIPYILSFPGWYGIGCISKYDASGNHIWTKTLGGNDNTDVYDVRIDNQNNIYLSGFFDGPTDFDPGPSTNNLTAYMLYDDIFLVKLDPWGNFLWAKQVGGNKHDGPFDLEIDNLNNVYLAGYFSDTADFDLGPSSDSAISNGMRDAFLLKLDSAGNYLWSTNVGGTGPDMALGIAVDDSNNVYYAGTFRDTVNFNPQASPFIMYGDGVDYSSLFVSKLYSDGQFAWAFQFNAGYGFEIELSIDNMNSIYCNGGFRDTCDFNPDTSISNLMSEGGLDGFIIKFNQPKPIPEYHFNIYPNPNDGSFNLELPMDASYFLFDMLGRIVFEGNGVKGINSIGLKNLANGVYNIYVQYDAKFFSAGKVLVVN